MSDRRANRKRLLGLLLIGIGAFGFSAAVHAQGLQTGIEYGAYTGLTGGDIRVTIANIIRVALGFLGILAVLIILYGGFLWMTAGGSQERIDRAKKTLTAAIIGLVIIATAFAIASFVINSLVSATTGPGGTGPGGSGPGGGGFGGGGAGGFRPTAIQPSGDVDKRDVVATVTFNTRPTSDVANIRNNILLEKLEGGGRTEVAYTPSVVNDTIRLVPDAACPSPNEDRNCLDANGSFVVTIRAGLQSDDGLTVNCGFTAVCSEDFTTGEAVGTEPPTVSVTNPTDGQSVRAGDLIQVQTLLGDEYGIASVEYFADGAFFAADGNIVTLGPETFSSQVSWDTAGIAPVKEVGLRARATNIDGDETESAGISVVLRPEHCFNGVQDEDETGPDCGGADCGSCTGGSCTENSDCASGQCVEGQCVVRPKITDVQLRDGAPGNLVTVTGNDLGTGTGTVTFLGDIDDDTDDVQAPLAQCSGSWGSARVFIAVPEGAVSGPIRLTTSAGRSDATNDTFGPIIPDFQVNDVSRPGICGLDPTSAKTGQTLTLSGQGFGDAQGDSRVQFARAGSDCLQVQSFAEGADAGSVDPWAATSVQPTVPNLETGANGTNYLVRVTTDQPSNTVCMRALPPEAGTEPRIDFISPEGGSVGAYVTLFGENFGSSGTVRFERSGAGEAVGSTDFPAQCGGGFWQSDRVTVKVPEEFTTPSDTALELGGYQVTVRRSDGRGSNAVSFEVNNDPLAPGLCHIDPLSGPANTPVTLYGERLGSVPSDGLDDLVDAHPDAVLFHDGQSIDDLSRWNNTAIGTSVPSGAETGPVSVRVYENGTFRQSNPVNFEVMDCRDSGGDAACGENLSCCGDGSCRADCAELLNRGGYAWRFSTGPIPVFPVVLENATCQISEEDTITPSPNPYRNARDVCTDIGAVTVRFSLPMDESTFTGSSILLEACEGDQSLTGECAPVATGIPSLTTYDAEGRSMLSVPVSGLDPSTWHRLTVTDDVMSSETPERSAQSLDGDFDGQGGGEYVTQFKTGEGACTLAGVDVQPGKGLIDASDATLGYQAFPLSERCVVLQCGNRNVVWGSSDTSKATIAPAGGAGVCTTTASPVAETAPGPDIRIEAEIEGFDDFGDLKIDYANPRVVHYGPRDCNEACINSMPFAVFNTTMATSGPGNVLTNAHLFECVNESCLAFNGETPVNFEYDEASKMLTFDHGGLLPNTFYRVVIDGTAMSTSNAMLTGLNYQDTGFSWIFRTRESGDPCGPQAVGIVPAQTTLRYIGQVKAVNAVPKTEPDTCSETGQLLTANSFDWAWDKDQSIPDPEAFTLLPDFPTVLKTNPNLPNGCTSRCLAAGSEPPGTPECGNGILEYGEACDTPGTDGCTARCLRTGNTEANGCGDGIVDAAAGEECDAGEDNGEPESGCTASCKLTGSVPGLSVCGNASAGVGEACDDGNRENGDGCSANCRWEGSDQNVAVCGNGILDDPHEQCDYERDASGQVTRLLLPDGDIPLGAGDVRDPNAPGFPCSSSCLLKGNGRKGADEIGLCGNGVIEPKAGEGCDAGPANGKAGSGCSSRCTRTGEDITLGAFCGDTVQTVKAADPLTGIEHGGGEDCEAGTFDENIDPRQVVEALAQCDARNNCTGSVTATVEGVSGDGGVSVECSCRTDSDCTTFDAGLACGAGACCFPRPAPPDIEPNGGAECRNAAITVTFDEEMDHGSLTGNITVEECGGIASRNDGPWYARAFRAVGNFFRSLFGRDASAQTIECNDVTGRFDHANLSRDDGTTFTRSRFIPDQVLLPETTYQVRVQSGPAGVRTVTGVGYRATTAIVQPFSTGTEICSFDVLQLAPSSFLIQSSDKEHGFRALAMTEKDGLLRPISPVPDVYDWSWDWKLAPLDDTESDLTLTVDDPPTETATVQATTGVNGREQLIATATITNDDVLDPSTVDETRVGKAIITTFLCENPWPRRKPSGVWEPYEDPATHFEFYYCRDSGDGQLLPELRERPTQGQSGGVTTGLLSFCTPATPLGELDAASKDGTQQPKICSADADCGGSDVCRAKDLFLQFRPEWRLPDAIGIRVAANINHLAPQTWYDDRRFSGATEPLEVDGYNAIKDERTIYVSAADKYGDPELRSYVYIFGHNQDPDSRTVGIFDQIIANLRFNTNLVGQEDVVKVCKDAEGNIIDADNETGVYSCSTDMDCFQGVPNAEDDIFCDAPKDKLRRDMERWEDLHAMTEGLDDIRDQTGFYPQLESGSFIRGMTTSKWPSWSQLGSAAVQDPINEFNRCDTFGSECSVTRASCSTDADCDQETPNDVCEPKYEAETCFNNRAEIFMCPAGSHVYQYRGIAGFDYRIQAEFEYLEYPWGGACEGLQFQFLCEDRIGCFWDGGANACRSRITIEPACFGLFDGNACLGGTDHGTECTSNDDCRDGGTCQPKGVALFGPAVPGSETCGNGLVEGAEVCEIGDVKTLNCGAGFQQVEQCRNDCSGYDLVQACPGAADCNNGVIEAGESCDDGALNGEYGRCRTGDLGCTKRCVNTSIRDQYVPGDVKSSDTCASNAYCETNYGASFVCTDRMNFCGDGVRNGPESCDHGKQNGKYGRCAWDCSGPGPRCGDLVVNGPEQCDGGSATSVGVCVPNEDDDPADIAAYPNGDASGCTTDSDCGADAHCVICAPTTDGLPQSRTKSCNSPTHPESCTFGGWSKCQPAGACGNGVVEGSEQCDDGGANSETGRCRPDCRLNVCNDGFLHEGVEQCDNGAQNGTPCSPEYGLTCNYCKNDCTIETISGAFCGDGIMQSPPAGPETCDPGSVSAWCSKTYVDTSKSGTCRKDADNTLTAFGCDTDADCGADEHCFPVKGCRTDNNCETGLCRYYPQYRFITASADTNRRFVDRAREFIGRFGFLPPILDGDLSWPERIVRTSFSFSSPLRLAAICTTCDPGGGGGSGGSGGGSGGGSAGTVEGGQEAFDPGTSSGEDQEQESGRWEIVPPPADDGTVPCHSADDCGSDQYCEGGEGQCLPYNATCTPDPYSNILADPDSSAFINGNCINCSNSCQGSLRRSPFFCGDGIHQPDFGEQCEGVGDPGATGPDGTNTFYDCAAGCTFDEESGYCGDGVVQAEHGEVCDQGGQCVSGIHQPTDLYLKVDMIFTIDISGTMGDEINDIAEAIDGFVEDYEGTEHRFGAAVFGQSGGSSLETNGPDGRRYIDLTSVTAFQSALEGLAADGGASEPSYDSMHALASSSNAYGISWRSDAHPYIVLVTDEPAQTVTGLTESDVASRVANCDIAGCAGKPGFRVETFVIANQSHVDQWDSILYGETDERFIDLAATSFEEDTRAEYYENQLRGKTFQNVCAQPDFEGQNVALNDSFSTAEGQPYYSTSADQSVAYNDFFDGPSSEREFIVTKQPDHGTLGNITGPDGTWQITPSGGFNYVPDDGYNGTDTFQYKFIQSGEESNVATVTMTVGSGN